MDTLLGQLLLVLSVALVVAAEYEEFGCKFDDEHYNYRDGKEDFGEYVKTMKFDNTTEFKLFMKDLEEIRSRIWTKSKYDTVDPFLQMYKDYKIAKERNPAYKFADFFPNYKPVNPYENAQRFPNITIFSVISIYRAMKTEFGNKYPAFKDSFVLATCQENITGKAVLKNNVKTGMEQLENPRRFEHDRIVGVVPFLILEDEKFVKNVRGFVIVESTDLTSRTTLAPIIMERQYANHTLNKNEVQLLGPTVARYKWLPNQLDSYIRIDYVKYVETRGDVNTTKTIKSPDGKLWMELVTQTDLLFMTPKSLCPFVKHVWKNNLLDTHVRLLKQTSETRGGTRDVIDFELEHLFNYPHLFAHRTIKEIRGGEVGGEIRMSINTSENTDYYVFDESKRFHSCLRYCAAIFDVEKSSLYDVTQQMSNIQQNDKDFLKEFITYVNQRRSSTFWNLVRRF